MLIMYYQAFISTSLTKIIRIQGFNNIQLNSIFYLIIIKKTILFIVISQLKNYFIYYYYYCCCYYYYIQTFLPHDNSFGNLLVFLSFLETYFDIYFYCVLFFSPSDKLLYISLACTFNLSLLFHNNPQLYLVSRLGFFDNRLNKCSHSFLYITKNFLLNTYFVK